MTTVELEVLAADLPAFLDKVAAGETILIADHHRPVAELRPPTQNAATNLDAPELARRRELGDRIEELRARTVRSDGPSVDSVDIIREMRDHPRHELLGH